MPRVTFDQYSGPVSLWPIPRIAEVMIRDDVSVVSLSELRQEFQRRRLGGTKALYRWLRGVDPEADASRPPFVLPAKGPYPGPDGRIRKLVVVCFLPLFPSGLFAQPTCDVRNRA